jgi:TPP-dependent pyruvate/acetoin dehydrogenase alpha subunit
MDVLAVEAAARKAGDALGAGSGPWFLECRTYRFRAHSMFDPELYRDKSEVAEWKQRDPIDALDRQINAEGWAHEPARAALDAEVAREIDEAIRFAESGTWEPIETLTQDVYTAERAHA